MDDKSLTITIMVDRSPREVFKAITQVHEWWSEEIVGDTEKLNDEFAYQYKDVHRCKMRLVELIPDTRVVWLVLDNYFNFTKDKSEWKGTKICFDISKLDDKTHVRFTHVGLYPSHECYGICTEAWDNYIRNSLQRLIITGKGQPNPKQGDGFNSQLAGKWKLEQERVQH